VKVELNCFEEFPTDQTCPVCGTNENLPCTLVAIDGTSDGSIAQAKPVHVKCALANKMNEQLGVIYRHAGK
jgi:hypothetical protein